MGGSQWEMDDLSGANFFKAGCSESDGYTRAKSRFCGRGNARIGLSGLEFCSRVIATARRAVGCRVWPHNIAFPHSNIFCLGSSCKGSVMNVGFFRL